MRIPAAILVSGAGLFKAVNADSSTVHAVSSAALYWGTSAPLNYTLDATVTKTVVDSENRYNTLWSTTTSAEISTWTKSGTCSPSTVTSWAINTISTCESVRVSISTTTSISTVYTCQSNSGSVPTTTNYQTITKSGDIVYTCSQMPTLIATLENDVTRTISSENDVINYSTELSTVVVSSIATSSVTSTELSAATFTTTRREIYPATTTISNTETITLPPITVTYSYTNTVTSAITQTYTSVLTTPETVLMTTTVVSTSPVTITATSMITVTPTLTTISTTTTLASIVLCPTRTSNPTFTPPAPMPTDFTWGCPPGYLCKPKRENGCNFEQGLPADIYYCSLDECHPVVPLPSVAQYWGTSVTSNDSPLTNSSLKYDVTDDYFNMNPTDFGLDYSIFIVSEVLVYTSTIGPVASTPTLRPRQGQNKIPAACYDECNHCAEECQAVGKTPALCAADSTFNFYLNECEQCISLHAADPTKEYASFQVTVSQFESYCQNRPTSATATASATAIATAAPEMATSAAAQSSPPRATSPPSTTVRPVITSPTQLPSDAPASSLEGTSSNGAASLLTGGVSNTLGAASSGSASSASSGSGGGSPSDATSAGGAVATGSGSGDTTTVFKSATAIAGSATTLTGSALGNGGSAATTSPPAQFTSGAAGLARRGLSLSWSSLFLYVFCIFAGSFWI